MKKNKIARRLICYFSVALLLFSLLVGGSFALLFSRHTTELHRQELQTRAENIAETMYGFLSGSAPATGSGHGQGQGQGHGSESGNGMHGTGFGAYMRFLGDIAMSDVWVVDSDSKTITPGSDHMQIEYGELPADGEAVIDEALQGRVSFSESFSSLLGQRMVSVGVPIWNGTDAPIGAVLLHSPIQGISDSVWDGLKTLLWSTLLALLLAVPAAVLLSLRFTRPLNRMKATAGQLAQGQFDAKNKIRQNDEIGELAATMDVLADRLGETERERRRLDDTRRDFFSNISHELRTPVTVLRGSLEALCDGVVSDAEQVADYHSQMLGETMHLQRLVNDLLELSRLQNADFKIEAAPLELHQLLDDVARGMRRVAEPKGVRIETSSDSREFPFTGDYGRLRQMLVVVTDNAVKFSPPGAAVTLSLHEQDGRPAISISDCGPGIAPDEIPQIFERFHKGGTENRTGTGLGLPIARQIAVRHGISIKVESKPGNTVFTFFF